MSMAQKRKLKLTAQKFEVIAHQMGEHKTHVCMMQETWMTGNSVAEIQGVHFFHHGLEESTCNSQRERRRGHSPWTRGA
jgi:hypothetical protein